MIRRITPSYIEYIPVKNSEHDYARIVRASIRCAFGEFCQSIFSVEVPLYGMGFLVPNRDLPYEGLLSNVGNSVWKYVDSIAFSSEDKFKPSAVRVSPNKITYIYASNYGELEVSYRIGHSNNACILSVEYGGHTGEIYIAPFLDIRHFYADSKPEEHDLSLLKEKDGIYLKAWRSGRELLIGPFSDFTLDPYVQEWVYKLDSGFRRIEDGKVIFVKDRRWLLVPGYGILGGEKIARINIACSVRGLVNVGVIDDKPNVLRSPFKRFRDSRLILHLINFRIATLSSFGLKVNVGGRTLWIPEAGGWWFREAWFRDAMEGIYWNLRTYIDILNWRDEIEDTLSTLLKLFYGSCSSPCKLPADSCRSADSIPLLLINAFKCSLITGEAELAELALGFISDALKRMKANSSEMVNGDPVLRDWLIYSVPSHSWIDSVVPHSELGRIPSRIPEDLASRIVGERGADELFKPKFLLPEINALWLKALMLAEKASIRYGFSLETNVKVALSEMPKRFREKFLTKDGFYSLEYNGVKCIEPSSVGVVSLSLLREMFNCSEIRDYLRYFESIFVFRKPVYLKGRRGLFGVLVNRRRIEPYLNDRQYHGSVIWPRDTPYLIDLLKLTRRDNDVKCILINHLDHMITEGVALYSSELFSLAYAGRKLVLEENPVPVKNQIQYWSHWCDPYIENLELLL